MVIVGKISLDLTSYKLWHFIDYHQPLIEDRLKYLIELTQGRAGGTAGSRLAAHILNIIQLRLTKDDVVHIPFMEQIQHGLTI
jgi:hypothetical protein